MEGGRLRGGRLIEVLYCTNLRRFELKTAAFDLEIAFHMRLIEFVSAGNTIMGLILRLLFFFSRWQVCNEDRWAWLTERPVNILIKRNYILFTNLTII